MVKQAARNKSLGYFDDEKEAACKYDEQAALLNKPVNFPQHEGQEQAMKQEGSVQGTRCDEAIQVRGSDLEQSDEEVASPHHDR